MGDISIDAAHLLGWALGMAFYGLYVCIFAITMWILRKHQHNRGIIFWAIVILFIISTIQTIICCIESYDGWINHLADPGPGAWFLSDGNPWQPIKDTFVYLGTIFADALVCWRVYVVWSHKRWLLVAPILLLTVGTISGALVVFYEARTVMVDDDRYLVMSSNLTIVVIVCTLVNNLLTTSLIAGRLWWINRQVQAAVSRRRSDRYKKVMAALIESGALYTITMVTLIILYGAGAINGVFLAAYIVPMVIGIFPTLIVLQVNITSRLGMETTRQTGGTNLESGMQTPGGLNSNATAFGNPSNATLSGASKTRTDHKENAMEIQVDVSRANKSDPAGQDPRSARKNKKSGASMTSSVPERRVIARKQSSLDDATDDSDDVKAEDSWAAPDLPPVPKGAWNSVLGQKTNDVEMSQISKSG